MNVQPVKAWPTLKWEEDRTTYRADIWTQPKAPEGAQQEFIGWRLASYALSEVGDVTDGVEWAEAKTRDARTGSDVHAAVCALYVVVRTAAEGEGIVHLYGVNPTRAA